jgi:hypothetical protein
VDGHLSGDTGAFLADAERKQSDRLAAKRALVEIEVLLAYDMLGVGTAQNRAEFLANGNEDGDHGSRRFAVADAAWRLGDGAKRATTALAAAAVVAIAICRGSNGRCDFSFRERLLDVGLDEITLACEVAPARGDAVVGIHM